MSNLTTEQDIQFDMSQFVNTFLQTDAIQNLPSKHKQDLKQLIKNFNDHEQLKSHLNKLNTNNFLNINQLEGEIKRKTNSTQFDIDRIIYQILKNRQERDTTSEYFKKHLSNTEFFNNHLMKITSPNRLYHINGIISQFQLMYDNKIKLKLAQTNRSVYKIQLTLDDYIQRLKLSRSENQTIGKLIEEKIYNCTKKVIVFENKQVFINDNQPEELTSVLVNGKYKISIYLSEPGKLQKIVFKDLVGKQISFEIMSNWFNKETIKNENWNKQVLYSVFENLFNVFIQQVDLIQYKNLEESNSCIIIRKDNNNSEENKHIVLNNIKNEKQKLRNYLMKQQFIGILTLFIDKLITSKDFTKEKQYISQQIALYKDSTLRTILYDLVVLYKQIKIKITIEEILKEVLTQINYSLLVKKTRIIDTLSVENILTESAQSLNSLFEKNIIAFFGATGSGKSASINYLAGYPMKMATNKFGDSIFTIDQAQYNKSKFMSNYAKIGHSISSSETTYSKGYPIQLQNLNQKTKYLCKNIVLCDNPGFNDTRGHSLEIFTKINIDMAMIKCNSVQAIVLVIPYPEFTSQKSNHIVDLIETMTQRFPEIMTKESDSYNVFHILITKFTNNEQIFQSRIRKHIQTQKQNIKNLEKNEENDFSVSCSKNRKNIFQVILDLLKKKRVQFIKFDNESQRQNILKSYLNNTGKSFPKQKYYKSIQDGSNKHYFFKYLSKSAHTWSVLLLNSFFNSIPKRIDESYQFISQSMQNIVDIQKQVKQIIQSQETIQKQIVEIKNKKTIQLTKEFQPKFRTKRSNGKQSLPPISKINQMASISPKKDDKVKKTKQSIKKQKQKINQAQLSLKSIQSTISKQKDRIKELKAGVQQIKIFQLKYKHGEVIDLKSLRRQINQTIVAGQKQVNLWYFPIISKEFALVHNRGFDPYNLIKKNNQKYGKAIRKQAYIKARHVALRRICQSIDKRSIVLHIQVEMRVCDKDSELPYLLISHREQNEIINQAQIQNIQQEIRGFNLQLQLQKSTIRKAKRLINDHQRTLQHIKRNDLLQQNQQQQQKSTIYINTSFVNNLSILQKNKQKYNKDLTDLNQSKEQISKSIKDTKADLEVYKFTYKRIAYLIKDQIQKIVPQSLFEFIQMTLNANKTQQQNDRNDPFYFSNQDSLRNFLHFTHLYKQKKQDMMKSLKEAMENKKYAKQETWIAKLEIHEEHQKKMFPVISQPINQQNQQNSQNNNQNATNTNILLQLLNCSCCSLM